MTRSRPSLPLQGARDALAPINCGALAVLAVFALTAAVGAMRLPDGYDGTVGLNLVFSLAAVFWALGLATRALQPGSRLGAAVQAIALMGALTFAGALAAAALALGGGAYVDPALVAADRIIAPFLDSRAMYGALDRHPGFYRALFEIYSAINWQPFAAIGLGLFFGSARRIDTIATAWAFGLALAILPFHFLPAQGDYTYHHLSQAGFGWIQAGTHYPLVLEALRNGTTRSLTVDSVAGLVTVPSFHACAAVILACSFWPYRRLRWPMLALNVGMALAAVPVGSHYVIDVVTGAACGGVAFAAASALARRSADESARAVSPLLAKPAAA